MPQTISAWVDGEPDDVGQAVVFQREDDGAVTVEVMNEAGTIAAARVPAETWFAMARQIFQSRSRMSMTVEFGTRH